MNDSGGWSWLTLLPETADAVALRTGPAGLTVSLELRFDAFSALLSGVLCAVVALVLVQGWSEFRRSGRRWSAAWRFGLLMATTALLPAATDFLQLFICWQLSAFAAMLFIGNADDDGPMQAGGRRFFLLQRLADIPLLLSILLIWVEFGTLDIAEVVSRETVALVEGRQPEVVYAICVGMLLSAIGRCAQLPLCFWLDDVARGGGFATALAQGAAVMPAGVYLLVRCEPLFAAAPEAQQLLVLIGSLTALLAALAAVVQTDPLRALSYSSSSLFGLIFVGLGLGTAAGVGGAVLLLLVHSLTKPALFLVAGRSGLQTSAWIYFTGAIVLSSGMYGQNAILAPGLSGGLKPVVAALALSSMFIESAVLFRVGFRLLPRIGRRGDSRDSGERGVASQGRTWPMWLPVVVAIILGPMLSGWTFGNVGTGGVSLDTMLRETGVFSDDTTSGDTPFFSVGVTLPISLLGMVVAWMMQATSAKLPASANVMLATVVRLGENGFYLRDCFRLGFAIPVRLLARFCLFVETTVVGGVGRAVFWGIPVVVGRAAGLLQNGVVQFYALAMTLTLAVLLFALCWLKV